jgi:hypothetical protein
MVERANGLYTSPFTGPLHKCNFTVCKHCGFHTLSHPEHEREPDAHECHGSVLSKAASLGNRHPDKWPSLGDLNGKPLLHKALTKEVKMLRNELVYAKSASESAAHSGSC